MSANYDLVVRLSTIGQNEVSSNLRNIQGVTSSMAAGLNDADIGGKRLSATFKQVDADGTKMSVTMRQLADSSQMVRNTFIDASGSGVNLSDALSGIMGKLALLGVSIGGLVAGFKEFIVGGVAMNDTLETSQIRLGIVLESLYKYPQAANQHAAATADAAAQIAVLKDRSLEVLAPLADLLTMNQKLAAAMSAAGVASAQQANDFTLLVAKIGDVSGQSYEALAMQISRLITTGQLARGEFAQTLRAMGVTPDVIASWKAMGTTVDGQSILITNLSEKLKAYAADHQAILNTLEGAWKQSWNAIALIVGDAMASTADTIKSAVLSWRDLILDHREEITSALTAAFVTAGALIQQAINAWGTIVSTALAPLKGMAADAGLSFEQNLGIAIIDVGKALSTGMMIAADFVAVLQQLASISFAPLSAALLIPLSMLNAVLGGLASLTGSDVITAAAAKTDAALDLLGANVLRAVTGIATLTDKFAANKAAADATIASLNKMGLSLQGVQTGLADTGEGPVGMVQARTPGAATASPQLMAGILAAGQALAKLQAQLIGIGTGPEMAGVLKIEEGFATTQIEIDKVSAALQKVGADPNGILALRAQMQGLAVDIEKAKLDEFANLLSTKMEVALADLGAKFQVAGSQAAIFAETVKGLADLDKIQQTLKDDANAMLEWGLAIGKTIQDQGDRVEWLTAVWNNFEATRAQQRQDGADAQARFEAQQKLKAQARFDEENQLWTDYLNTVYQQNRAAGQNVTEAWNNALNTTSTKMTASAATVEQGLAAGIVGFQKSLGTVGQDVEKAVENIGTSLTSTLSTGFFDVITGKISDLGATFKKFGEDILKDISDVFAKMLERWLLTVIGIEQNPIQAGVSGGGGLGSLGLGGSAPGNVGVNEQGYMGGVPGAGSTGSGEAGLGIGAGLGLMGLGLGISTISNAQTTGQTAGGAMEMAGGVAAMIPVVGWAIGAVLVVVGALIAALSKPPEIHDILLMSGALNQQTQQDAVTKSVIDATHSSLLDVIAASTQHPDPAKIAALSKSMSEYWNTLFGQAGFDVAAGSSSDVQTDIQNFFKTTLPKLYVQAAGFGQMGYGMAPGDRNAPGGMAGINWNLAQPGGANEFMDQAGNWIKKQLYDPNAPIPLMLAGLGFTQAKIADLAQQLADTTDIATFQANLLALVQNVVALQDASKKLGRSFADINAQAAATAAQTPAEAITQSVSDLVAQAAILADYTGTDKTQKVQAYIQSVDQLISAEEQAAAQLVAMQQAIDAQGVALHDAVTKALQTPAEQARALEEQTVKDWAAVLNAANPADLQKAWATFNTDMTAYVNSLVARIQAIETLQQSIAAFQASIATPAIDPTKDLFGYLAQNAGQISQLFVDFQNATGDQQVQYAQQLFTALQNRYNYEMQEIQKITDMIGSINQSVQDQIFGIQQKGMTPQQNAQALWDKITAAQGQIPLATSPEQVQKLVQEIQGWVGQLQGLPVLPGQQGNVSQLLIDTLTAAQTAADLALSHMNDQLQSDLDKITGQLSTLATNLGTALTTAQTDLTTAMGVYDAALAAADGKINQWGVDLAASVQPLKDAVNTVIGDLTGTGGLTDAIVAATNAINNPGGTTGQPTGTKAPATSPTGSPKFAMTGTPTNGNAPPAPAALPPIAVNVNVQTGAPADIAAAVAANVSKVLLDTVAKMVSQAQVDLLTWLRAHPQLLVPTTGTPAG